MTDPSTTPGGLRDFIVRDLDDGGRIEFEFAPAGFLTRDGSIRRSDWRAYFHRPGGDCPMCSGSGRVAGARAAGKKCPACAGGGQPKRNRYISVTTLIESIVSKGGLPPWSEARGIEGAIEAVRRGLIDINDPHQDHIQVVRANRLGADRARDDAAERGLSIHALLELWMLKGAPPNPSDFPEAHRGYVKALAKWITRYNPQPIGVEQLVCSPQDGYAGRMDLKAHVAGLVGLYDLKTQANAGIYSAAHLQLALYERADLACGGEPATVREVVVLAENGDFRVQPCMATSRTVDAALAYYAELKPIETGCATANRTETEARKPKEAIAA